MALLLGRLLGRPAQLLGLQHAGRTDGVVVSGVADRFQRLPVATPGIEAVLAESRRTFDRHSHDSFGVGVMEHGAQRSSSGRGQVEAGPGDVITCNAGEVHDGAPIGDNGRRWRMLYFEPSAIVSAVSDLAPRRLGAYAFTRPTLSDPGVASLTRRLFMALTAAHPESLCQDGLVLALFARLGEAHEDLSKSRAPAAIALARARIDDDPAAAVTLADLARETGLSRWQVLRGFAKSTGFTPHAYLMQKRMDLARRLIAAGVPLAEASVASGYADQSHMTRSFRSRYGFSPKSWAKPQS